MTEMESQALAVFVGNLFKTASTEQINVVVDKVAKYPYEMVERVIENHSANFAYLTPSEVIKDLRAIEQPDRRRREAEDGRRGTFDRESRVKAERIALAEQMVETDELIASLSDKELSRLKSEVISPMPEWTQAFYEKRDARKCNVLKLLIANQTKAGSIA